MAWRDGDHGDEPYRDTGEGGWLAGGLAGAGEREGLRRLIAGVRRGGAYAKNGFATILDILKMRLCSALVAIVLVHTSSATPVFARDIAKVYGALLNHITVPNTDWFMNIQPGFQMPCSAEVLTELASSLKRGLYGGSSGAFSSATQMAACEPVPSVKAELTEIYQQHNRPDAQSLALVAYATQQITATQYESLARENLAAIGKPIRNNFSFFTGFIAIRWAAGECYANIVDECIRVGAKRILPAGWPDLPFGYSIIPARIKTDS